MDFWPIGLINVQYKCFQNLFKLWLTIESFDSKIFSCAIMQFLLSTIFMLTNQLLEKHLFYCCSISLNLLLTCYSQYIIIIYSYSYYYYANLWCAACWNVVHWENSPVVESKAQWRMDDNVIGRPVWNRMFLILTDDERSKRRGIAMAIIDERYEGSPNWRTIYVSVATLKSILHLIGNQCMLWRIAEMLDRPCWRVTTQVSVFWIHSSLCRTEVEAPINTEFAQSKWQPTIE